MLKNMSNIFFAAPKGKARQIRNNKMIRCKVKCP
jgi:hypothetical protein